jgi:hypothetical protein
VSGDLNTDDWNIFYVGESADFERRHAEHIAAGKAATPDSTAVYRYIHELDRMGIPWTMQVVQEYGSEEGPEAKEAEVMVKFTLAGVQLQNEKNGNMHWCQVLDEMSYLGIAEYSEWLVHRKALKAEEDARKVTIPVTIDIATKAQRKLSAEKRRVARETGLLPSRKKKK